MATTHEYHNQTELAQMEAQPLPKTTTYQAETLRTVTTPAIVTTNQAVNTTIFLKPIANPSALGLAGFFASTWVLSTYLCAWYGGDTTVPSTFGYFMIFGGLGQFIAGLYGFQARDNFAVVIHVAWGSFFLGKGIEVFTAQIAGKALAGRYADNDNEAMIYVTLAALTWLLFVASFGRDLMVCVTTFLLACGATLAFGGYFDGSRSTIKAGGYFLMLSALTALYRVGAYLFEEAAQEKPMWWPNKKLAWEKRRPAVQIPTDEPGVKKGQ